MDFSFLSGKGADVSPTKISGVTNASHFYAEPNNLYTLKDKFDYESLDFIISQDLIFSTKFHRILLKEWMNFCKVGGSIVVIFKEEKEKNRPYILSELFTLFGNDIEVDWALENENVIVIIKKKKTMLRPEDSIDKWTFGVITRKGKEVQVDKVINSIISQKIPNFEVIVCGDYSGIHKDSVKFIKFNQKDDKGWITKKKNLIIAAASYENVMVIHDRIILDKNWFSGMKKYGNYFDVLSCPQLLIDTGLRAGDWMTPIPYIGLLNYLDWDKNLYLNGALYIIKKMTWEKVPWSEYLFWNEGEDLEVSRRFHQNGIVPRFNPYSICHTHEWRHGILPEYEMNSQKIGNLKSGFQRNLITSLRAYNSVFFKLNTILPRISPLFNLLGISRLQFTTYQSILGIIKTNSVINLDNKVCLTEIQIHKFDKTSNVLYFSAADKKKEVKRYKAIELDKKTLIYLEST